MPLTFICEECAKRFFFQDPVLFDGKKICRICDDSIRIEKIKHEIVKQREEKRTERKKINEQRANESLRKELEWEIQKQKQKQHQALERKEQTSIKGTENTGLSTKQKIAISIEREAIEASRHIPKVLYVFADVKHVRAIEWLHGKKRVLLNREREIRRTHKGGYSQEKFQKFVDMKKRKTAQWVEEHLLQPGVLRKPYDKIFIDTSNEDIEEAIGRATKQ